MEKQFRKLLSTIANFISPEKLLFCYYTFLPKGFAPNSHNPNTVDEYCSYGPIFLRRFKLYMFSFTFGFMFANIYFEENQNSKIYVMFIINIT